MKPMLPLLLSALLLALTPPTQARQTPVTEPGDHGGSGQSDPVDPIEPPELDTAHPDAMNTATCNFHGTASPADANYTKFATSLTGPRGRKGLSLQSQVEQHHAGAVSVAIIENGVVTQHHWYGCRDRASAQRSATTTIYSTASLSKFVTAIALVKAARAGTVNLDRSVQAYADEHGDSLLAEWVNDKFDGDFTKDYPKSITLRRLLSHTAGLDTHGIGAWEPGNVPSMRDILMGTDGHSNSFLGGVEPIAAPSVAKVVYSGGGYIVAEHILQLESPLSFENYVKENVLDVAGHKLSTYDLAQPSMGNLARPCSRGSCGDYILQTRVKAAGGLLANVREYATLVATLATGGKTPTGREVMQQADINTLLTPAERVGQPRGVHRARQDARGQERDRQRQPEGRPAAGHGDSDRNLRRRPLPPAARLRRPVVRARRRAVDRGRAGRLPAYRRTRRRPARSPHLLQDRPAHRQWLRRDGQRE